MKNKKSDIRAELWQELNDSSQEFARSAGGSFPGIQHSKMQIGNFRWFGFVMGSEFNRIFLHISSDPMAKEELTSQRRDSEPGSSHPSDVRRLFRDKDSFLTICILTN